MAIIVLHLTNEVLFYSQIQDILILYGFILNIAYFRLQLRLNSLQPTSNRCFLGFIHSTALHYHNLYRYLHSTAISGRGLFLVQLNTMLVQSLDSAAYEDYFTPHFFDHRTGTQSFVFAINISYHGFFFRHLNG